MTPAASDAPARPRSSRLELDAWGVVFCGGESRRMGTDKARLELGGRTLIRRAVATLQGVVPRVLLASGSTARYPELDLECVLDREAGSGPLAGLVSALSRVEEARIDYLCALACDMPNASTELFHALLARARRTEAEVALVTTPSGPEPLCAVYSHRALPAVAAALARGERRLSAFHCDLRVTRVPDSELAPGCTRNLNTPEDFRAAGGRA